jgi:hypothetical protein
MLTPSSLVEAEDVSEVLTASITRVNGAVSFCEITRHDNLEASRLQARRPETQKSHNVGSFDLEFRAIRT